MIKRMPAVYKCKIKRALLVEQLRQRNFGRLFNQRKEMKPEIFEVLQATPVGRNREIQLTDALQRLLERHEIYAYEIEGERYDMGTPLGWLQATITLALRSPDIGPKLRDYLDGILQHTTRAKEIH